MNDSSTVLKKKYRGAHFDWPLAYSFSLFFEWQFNEIFAIKSKNG